MSGGGKEQPQTQTTQYVLSPEQRELYNIAMPGIREFAAKVPQRFAPSGSAIAGFDPLQVQAQNLALGAAGPQADVAGAAAKANQFLLGDIWNPASNPNLARAIEVGSRPIMETLTEQALPAIRGSAVQSSGGFTGGSRQGIAEGLAAGRAASAVGDVGSKVVTENYQANLAAQLRALGLAPAVQAMQLAPAQTTGAVGDVRQAMAQALMSEARGEEMGAFNWQQYAPFLQSQDIIGLAGGMLGGQNVATASMPQRNRLAGALGGAASGAAMGSMFGPYGTAIGAGGGALMGLFA